MTGHRSWSELRDQHLQTPEARAAYERAKARLELQMAGKCVVCERPATLDDDGFCRTCLFVAHCEGY